MSRHLNIVQTKLQRLFERGIPCIIIGDAGTGKSAIVREVADNERATNDSEFGFIDKRLPLCESVDLRGNPVANHETKLTEWFRPADLPLVGNDHFPDRGIMVLEELNASAASVQVASYQMLDIRNRGIGEHKIKPGWYICATGNRTIDKAGAQKMNRALGNRLAWLYQEIDVTAWAHWALAAGISIDLVAYIMWRGVDGLYRVLETPEFPSPRSWENASRFMDLERSERMGLVSACVGHGAAADFESFMDIRAELEPIPYILANPTTAKVPSSDKLGALYAVTMAVAAAIDKRTAKAGATYALRLPAMFRALFAQSVLMRDRSLAAYGFAGILAADAGMSS